MKLIIFLEGPSIDISLQELLTEICDRIDSISDVLKKTIVFHLPTSLPNVFLVEIKIHSDILHSECYLGRLVVTVFAEEFKYSLICFRHPTRRLPHEDIASQRPVINTVKDPNGGLWFCMNYVIDPINHWQQTISSHSIIIRVGITSGRCPDEIARYSDGGSSRQKREPMEEASARCGSDRLGVETMSTEGNPTENTVESSENKLALRHSNSRNNSRVIADGGATWNDLTGFQRDMLEAIAELECDGEVPYGLAVKEELNRDYHEDVNHGRLYPNLDQLVEYGFIEKNELDRRTNEYPLTETGRRMLETRTRRMAQSLGLNVESANQAAVTDGGRDER